MSHILTTDTLSPEQVAAVLALAEAVRDADGVAALSEQTLLRVRHGARGRGRFHLAYVDAEQGRVLAGCAFAEVSRGNRIRLR